MLKLRPTTGLKNTANGNRCAVGQQGRQRQHGGKSWALGSNTGSFNTAVGFNAGANLTTGSNNIDIGNLGVAGESNTMRIATTKLTATYIYRLSMGQPCLAG